MQLYGNAETIFDYLRDEMGLQYVSDITRQSDFMLAMYINRAERTGLFSNDEVKKVKDYISMAKKRFM